MPLWSLWAGASAVLKSTGASRSIALLSVAAVAACSPGFPDGLAIQLQLVCVVDQAVQQGVGDRWIADGVVPQLDLELAGQDGGVPAVAVLQDLQHVPPLPVRERSQAPVVDDQQLGPGELGEFLAVDAFAPGHVEIVHQARETLVQHGVPLPARLVRESAGEPASSPTFRSSPGQ